jgi:MFS family permease
VDGLVKLNLGGDLESRNRDFLRLWTSGTVNSFTGQFSNFVFPVLAVLLFHATPFEMGLLIALEILPLPILSPFIGVWVDRVKRLRIIVLSNVAQMLVFASVPISFFLGTLSLIQIFAVVLVSGGFECVARTAYQTYLPTVVARDDLAEANQKFSVTGSAASVVGPSLAGIVYQIIGGAFSVAFDAIGFLISAIILRKNTKEEDIKLHPEEASRGFFFQMRRGLEFTLGNKILRGVMLTGVWSSLGNSMAVSMYTIFILNYLHFSPATFGVLVSFGSVGYVVGVVLARKVVKWLGVGVTLAVAITSCLVQVIQPLALHGFAIPIIAIAEFVVGLGAPIYTIPQVVVKQSITPRRLQGRMNANMNTFVWGTMVVGATLGGILGGTIGVVNTIYLGGLISGTSAIWIILSPVIKLKKYPEEATEATTKPS